MRCRPHSPGALSCCLPGSEVAPLTLHVLWKLGMIELFDIKYQAGGSCPLCCLLPHVANSETGQQLNVDFVLTKAVDGMPLRAMNRHLRTYAMPLAHFQLVAVANCIYNWPIHRQHHAQRSPFPSLCYQRLYPLEWGAGAPTYITRGLQPLAVGCLSAGSVAIFMVVGRDAASRWLDHRYSGRTPPPLALGIGLLVGLFLGHLIMRHQQVKVH